jgi:hypothetical protein
MSCEQEYFVASPYSMHVVVTVEENCPQNFRIKLSLRRYGNVTLERCKCSHRMSYESWSLIGRRRYNNVTRIAWLDYKIIVSYIQTICYLCIKVLSVLRKEWKFQRFVLPYNFFFQFTFFIFSNSHESRIARVLQSESVDVQQSFDNWPSSSEICRH